MQAKSVHSVTIKQFLIHEVACPRLVIFFLYFYVFCFKHLLDYLNIITDITQIVKLYFQ